MATLFDDAEGGLTPADFEVFAPQCWSSNQFNLGRMRAKARLLHLCAPLAALPEAAALTLESSAEVPGVWNGRTVREQWVYLLRPPELRRTLAPIIAARAGLAAGVREPAEHQRHVTAFVRLHHDGVEVGFRLPAGAVADVATLAARRRDAALPPALVSALSALPDALRLDDGPPAVGFAAAFDALQASTRADLRVAANLDRATVLAAGPALPETVRPLLRAALSVYACVAFTPEDDPAGLMAPMPSTPRPPAGPPTSPAVGATVHLTRGLLAGRAGVVTGGPGPKGYFKVRVGTLEVQVPGAELRTS